MAKKEKSKKKESKEKTEPKSVKPESFDEEKPFDLGGLPQRDLKKNLGCG